jgi:hypothetical protein
MLTGGMEDPSDHCQSLEPLEEILKKARSLVDSALRYNREERTATQHVVTHHPGCDYSEMAGALVNKARHEVTFSTGPVFTWSPDEITGFRRDLQAAAQRGVAVRLLYHAGRIHAQGRLPFLRDMAERGVKVRLSRTDADGIVMTDSTAALVWHGKDQPTRHCQIVRSPAILNRLIKFADSQWLCAWELDLLDGFDRDEDDISLQVLYLLSHGFKDETAARHLEVSVRTYRRHVAEVLAMLKASSRFEAGVRASQLGLIPGNRQARTDAGRSAMVTRSTVSTGSSLTSVSPSNIQVSDSARKSLTW